ncbi:glycoside hydrolase family 13 protein [Galbitalea sp. SE-J8]|uniref:glycoside hydrolase family 13 protein n=1 Tax=Galbitalea sp. SE-J8 TaxID=3054952 RepID=UPI00259C6E83|nr:glycoside hydrolase family 13 protein [Galbitalea sp. SE-J8]MDM4763565.1 glycoside hydrolase family 13 protein [Galbitalea sp. SE-J8]
MTSIEHAPNAARATATAEWWRTAVIYQIYPRSFADANGDGVGDLRGITGRLDAIAELGADAVWLSPFYTSPQNDAGYDVADYCDVDPLFGTLADFDELVEAAHALGIRVIVDLVPNHSSSEHRWFREALAAGPGSAERSRYIFRDGRGEAGELPPNNWQSTFDGRAWTRVAEADGQPGQWYLHLFDSSQPDFDWSNRWVQERFLEILRFWLDRGVDGFRVDVAHGLDKEHGLPDYDQPDLTDFFRPSPHWAQPGVHAIYREWRALLDDYAGDRVLCAEAWVSPLTSLSDWVRPDEMHQAFNFVYLATSWDAEELRRVIRDSLAAFGAVGAPSTWVLSNHDVVRHATRLGFAADAELFHGIGPSTPGLPDPATALRRARAATALMLALPGSAYLYQGEELGLPEALDIPDADRQDPAWRRSAGERYGRDGCRVPLPWEADGTAIGFNDTGLSWLPQPEQWRTLARDRQRLDPASTLRFYERALRLRREHALGAGAIAWERTSGDVMDLRNQGIRVIVNLGDHAIALPAGTVVLSSVPLDDPARLPVDAAVWMREE